MTYTEFSQTAFFKQADFIPGFQNNMIDADDWEYFSKRFDVWLKNYCGKTIKHSIPHKIHQIWIGSELPEKYKNWCKSWKKLNPDWEYKLWGEQDILPILNDELKYAFLNSKSFGPKGDIARYAILEKEGGVYCDTDFECTKPLDELTNTCTLFAGFIFSEKPEIAGGIFGSVPAHPLVSTILNYFKKPVLSTDSDTILNTTGPAFLTRTILQHKDTLLKTDVFFPSHYFYPFPNFCREQKLSPEQIKKKYCKDCTYGIHYWEVSWEKHGFYYYVKKIIKMLILWNLWKSKLKKK